MEQSSTTTANNTAGPKRRILIADDDSFLLNLYSLKFTKEGFEVITAKDGNDALKKLKDGLVADILLIDIIMPGMDGIELLEEIRKQKLVPDAAVIMLTNQSDSKDIGRSKDLGVDGYIVKATTIPSEVVSDALAIYNQKK